MIPPKVSEQESSEKTIFIIINIVRRVGVFFGVRMLVVLSVVINPKEYG
jgi:hypothetical protein